MLCNFKKIDNDIIPWFSLVLCTVAVVEMAGLLEVNQGRKEGSKSLSKLKISQNSETTLLENQWSK